MNTRGCCKVGKGNWNGAQLLRLRSWLCFRCSNGSHQLVRDAVPADARQGVPQSRPSAAGVPTGMRAATPNNQKHSRHPKEHTASPSRHPAAQDFSAPHQKHSGTIQQMSDFTLLFFFLLLSEPINGPQGRTVLLFLFFITKARDNCRETG